MNRRAFVAALGGAIAWPMVTKGQVPTVGILSAGSPEVYADLMLSLLNGLRTIGYVNGLNVTVESRYANGELNMLPELAQDLAQLGVAVITTTEVTSALGARAGAPTIPLAFLAQIDPVEAGLVAGLSHPGSNATGIYLVTADLISKRLVSRSPIGARPVRNSPDHQPEGAETQTQLQETEAAKTKNVFSTPINLVRASTPLSVCFGTRRVPLDLSARV